MMLKFTPFCAAPCRYRAESDGDPAAALWVGRQLYWGRGGVARDAARAAEFFARAAQAGHGEGLYNFGVSGCGAHVLAPAHTSY